MKLLQRLYLLSLGFLFFQPLAGQISQGGQPRSFSQQERIVFPTIDLPAPDLQSLLLEDEEMEKQGLPQRIAVGLPVNTHIDRAGDWLTNPEGVSTWRLRLVSPGALAMSICFDDFYLPAGARLFMYTDNRDFIIGAFTTVNNAGNRLFSTELVPGEAINIELEVPHSLRNEVSLSISEVSYLYRSLPSFLENRGSSDHCEVNVNCPEGESWQKQKRGVVRIYVKQASAYFWCTGSLLNNERMDRTPFMLTAEHCAPHASADDLAKWVFYFNYEAPGCENPTSNPPSGTMTGATLLSSNDVSGSDFMLVLLHDSVPESYSPFFNGWSAEDKAGEEGVTIHHPAGDIKKISTYIEPVISSQWSSTPNTHWQVFWTETESGWGVTEGGSSGAPLFNENGMMIGTLTGGLAACDPGGGGPGTGPDKPDYYGKFSYSWDQNGNTPEKRLKDWLDPDNTGISYLPGMNTVLTADFITASRIILAGGTISFEDLSSGPPLEWQWYFEGGEPETFTGKTPPEISYARGGKYDVRLIVSDSQISDTLKREGYIEVVGKLYPNPTRGEVSIYLGEEAPSVFKVEVFNSLGRVIYQQEYTDNISRLVTVDLSGAASGVYIVRIQSGQQYMFSKLMLIQQ